MISAPGGVTMGWDPLGRMAQIASGSGTTRFGYDGINMIAEYNASNALTRRYVHGPGTDDPIVWYEGAGTTDRLLACGNPPDARVSSLLMADERGSIVNVTNASGAILAINSYDEYGIPGTSNIGRFQYTGQVWLPEVGLYHYKARMYSPTLGRFMQTDPIGYADGMNWYAYVGNDPISFVDPLGMSRTLPHDWVPELCLLDGPSGGCTWTDDPDGSGSLSHEGGDDNKDIVVTGSRRRAVVNQGSRRLGNNSFNDDNRDIVVTATRDIVVTGMRFHSGGVVRSRPEPSVIVLDWCGSAGNSGAIPEAFPEACRIHDRCYGTIGRSQLFCDNQFARQMLRACERRGSGPICVTTAWVYYRFVRAVGGSPYRNAQRNAARRIR